MLQNLETDYITTPLSSSTLCILGQSVYRFTLLRLVLNK